MSRGSRTAIDAASDEGEAAPPLAWGDAFACALVAHSADIILVLTAEHRCLFANPALRDVLGYEPEAVLGEEVVPLHHPEDLPRVAAMLAEVAGRAMPPAVKRASGIGMDRGGG